MIMKKLLCLVLALLCIASFALADSVPSKSTADMVSVQVQGNIPADSGFVLTPVVDSITYQVAVEACQNQIEKLAASASVEAYFGEVKDGRRQRDFPQGDPGHRYAQRQRVHARRRGKL